MTEELESLLSKTALGDRAAFAALYQQASAQLFGVVVRILGRTDLAEEALQDGFVQIWQRAGDYQTSRARASVWMSAIVRYRALDLLRKHQRERPMSEFGELPEAAMEPPPLDTQTDLSRCLEELADDRREAIRMTYVQGLSNRELSERLGQPLGTVKSWVRRGLGQLKECLSR